LGDLASRPTRRSSDLALVEPLDAGARHRRTAVRGERDVVDADGAEHPGGLAGRRRDVVELQVEEHPEAQLGERADDLGTGSAVEDRKSTRLNSSHVKS